MQETKYDQINPAELSTGDLFRELKHHIVFVQPPQQEQQLHLAQGLSQMKNVDALFLSNKKMIGMDYFKSYGDFDKGEEILFLQREKYVQILLKQVIRLTI